MELLKLLTGRLAKDFGTAIVPAIIEPAAVTWPVSGAAADVAIERDVCAVLTPALNNEISGCSPAESALVTSHGAATLENSAHKPTPIHQMKPPPKKFNTPKPVLLDGFSARFNRATVTRFAIPHPIGQQRTEM